MSFSNSTEGDPLVNHGSTAAAAATAGAATSVVVNPQTKDLSDWRNIQLGQTPPFFDPFWPATTVNPWNTPPTPVVCPSMYNPWTSTNQPWLMPAFHLGSSLANMNSLQNNFLQQPPPPPPPPASNNVIDLTTNTGIPSTPISDFVPYAYAYPTPPVHPYPNPVERPVVTPAPSTEPLADADLILVPEIDIEEILGHVEAVIPDIDLDAARRAITAMNPVPSTNDIVTHFLDNGYTKKLKKSFSSDHDRQLSFKRSWSDTIDDIPKFLSSYADPISYFYQTHRKQSESYINHAKAFLLRAFPNIDKSILEQALVDDNHHFLPTIRKLETRMGLRTNAFLQRTTIRRSLEMLGRRRLSMTHVRSFTCKFHSDLSIGGVGRMPSASWLIKNNKFAYAVPHTPCEEFYDELRFAKNEVKIRRTSDSDVLIASSTVLRSRLPRQSVEGA